MSKFSPTVHFETEFEGDAVSMDLRSISREDFFKWMPYFDKIDDEGNLPQAESLKLVNDSAGMLPRYVDNFRGLKDTGGVEVTMQQAVDTVYFMGLVTVILMRLIKISQVEKVKPDEREQDSDEGKSGGPPREPTTG